MAAPARAKSESLVTVFDGLQKLLSRYAPPFKARGGKIPGKLDFKLTIPRAVSVAGAYGGKPVELEFAAIIVQKAFVGFYFMPVYMNSALKKKLSPALAKLLKGKACFHVKLLDASLLKDIEAALNEGMKTYKARGWLE
jgi:hypothetical protein